MNVDRISFTGTLLRDGRVLVVGGHSPTAVQASAELYDPATGRWTLTGSLRTPRRNHTATLLADGTVLVAGGSNSSGWPRSAELYDPARGRWRRAAAMTTAREHATATLLGNGRVLVAGGGNPSAAHRRALRPNLAQLERYRPHERPTVARLRSCKTDACSSPAAAQETSTHPLPAPGRRPARWSTLRLRRAALLPDGRSSTPAAAESSTAANTPATSRGRRRAVHPVAVGTRFRVRYQPGHAIVEVGADRCQGPRAGSYPLRRANVP